LAGYFSWESFFPPPFSFSENEGGQGGGFIFMPKYATIIVIPDKINNLQVRKINYDCYWMRKKTINYITAIFLALIAIVGARCLRIFLDAPTASAAANNTPPEALISTPTEYAELIVEPVITQTVTITLSTDTPQLPPTTTESPTPTPTPYMYGPTDFPQGVDPLTGLRVDNPLLLERRPMVIKITNFPRGVRPQWGLNLADHVYEYYIGDNLTRFIGIFYGQDAERVGPVRSARMFDEHIMRLYRGIFVFAYADDRVLEELMTPELIPYLVFETHTNCPPICRLEHHGMAYNNLFADTRALGDYISRRGADNSRQDMKGLVFGSQTPLSGQSGEKVAIHFTYASYNKWEYEPQRGKYLRYQEVKSDTGQPELEYLPLLDTLNLEQVLASNLIVLLVDHKIVYQSSSTQIVDQPVKGKGIGYAFRDGQIFPISWVANGQSRLFSLFLPDGNDYPLKPGNVWFEILGKTSLFEKGDDGGWNFNFQMP
jgi:hypothetical protein